MASIITKGQGTALMVLDVKTNKPIEIPMFAQEAIMQPIIVLKEWIRKRMRIGGIGKMIPGGKIKYYAYPKQTEGRDLSITYDDTTGKITGGIFGAEVDGMVGEVAATYGIKLASDELTLQAAQFLNHKFSKQDGITEGLENLIAIKLKDFYAELSENALVELKSGYVAAMGTMGKWATDTKYILPTSGIGLRVKSKTYAATAAGGLEAKADIVKQLQYRDKIGLKGGVETTYKFARGLNSSLSCLLEISSDINASIMDAVAASNNGFIPGLGINKERGIVTAVSYDGKTVNVEVISDMPARKNKAFNWNIIEVGKHGAMALPNIWNEKAQVKDAATFGLQFSVLEAIGLLLALKFLQPELMFSSFKA